MFQKLSILKKNKISTGFLNFYKLNNRLFKILNGEYLYIFSQNWNIVKIILNSINFKIYTEKILKSFKIIAVYMGK